MQQEDAEVYRSLFRLNAVGMGLVFLILFDYRPSWEVTLAKLIVVFLVIFNAGSLLYLYLKRKEAK